MAELTIKRGDAEILRAEITPYTAAASLRFMAKKSLSDADAAAVLDKTIGSGITITNAGDIDNPAVAAIAINPTDTQSLRNREISLYYELEDGDDHTLDEGTLIVQPKVILDELEA